MTQTKLIKKFYLEFEGDNTKETVLIDSSSSSIEVVQYDEDRALLNDFGDVDFPSVDRAFEDIGWMLVNSGWQSDGRTSKKPLDICVGDHPELSLLGLSI
jgi:hypothetical protein